MMHRAVSVLALACALALDLAHAVGTPAGTAIANQASVSFEVGGSPESLVSNTAVISVAEVIDLNLLVQTPQRLVASGDALQPLLLTLTNTGNGAEAFGLEPNVVVPGDEFDPLAVTPAIYFDTDGSGDLSPADVGYVAGTNDPQLAADESLNLILVSDIPASQLDGDRGLIELRARSLTGTGAPGSTLAGAGSGGTDSVLGASGGEQLAVAEYLVGQVSLLLTKSAVISDSNGGTSPVPGAKIAYTVFVSAVGTGAASGALFVDAIPANTTYDAGSLRLNGVAVTDGDDADAGRYSSTPPAVNVDLGDLVVGGAAQRVEFSVTID